LTGITSAQTRPPLQHAFSTAGCQRSRYIYCKANRLGLDTKSVHSHPAPSNSKIISEDLQSLSLFTFEICAADIKTMALKSWFPIPQSSQFSLANLPFGIISTASRSQPRPAVAIGEHVLVSHICFASRSRHTNIVRTCKTLQHTAASQKSPLNSLSSRSPL
jgi:hypothetical protein